MDQKRDSKVEKEGAKQSGLQSEAFSVYKKKEEFWGQVGTQDQASLKKKYQVSTHILFNLIFISNVIGATKKEEVFGSSAAI